jgi:glycosyl transferase family 25
MLKIFVINLEKRPDRLNFIKLQLDTLGLDFEKL